jgi:TRAP-type mannitol/chloroaromatic compound transport system substrate-binding protein
VFEKPVAVEEHMKPLYIKGHLDGKPVGCMLVDGGASVNIMPLGLFEKLGHDESDLKQINMSLSGFSGEHVEAKGIVSKELTVGSVNAHSFLRG